MTCFILGKAAIDHGWVLGLHDCSSHGVVTFTRTKVLWGEPGSGGTMSTARCQVVSMSVTVGAGLVMGLQMPVNVALRSTT